MLAPISWLKDYVDINVSPELLAKKLVAIGFEVEDIVYQNRQVSKVVVGKIVDVQPHPNADRLRVTKIDIGQKTLQVVTNVPVVGGEVVALALDGAKLSGGLDIKVGQLRGVLSEGMLTGLDELGLAADDVEGQKEGDIIRFADGTPLGTNALDALGFNDVILDVAVTANRPDCNSIYKLAKEVAVALNVDCREPQICFETEGADVADMVSVEVKNSELCPRYMAAGVRDIKIERSPAEMRRRLKAVGIRPINNIVDITNYVLIEIGQPMHAFDKKLIGGGKIVVRNACEGEQIVSLDGKLNTLDGSMLIIADAQKPVAIAGIMGGKDSGINDATTDIVFEAAKFARDNVRRTSRKLNLRSDSSARFEKGIDFASQKLAMERALTLIYQNGYGKIASGMIDVAVDFETERQIAFTAKDIKHILGCNVPKAALISILGRLGIRVEERKGCLVAHVREDREDIVGVNDIAEEFIRVYGYKHIKPTLFEYASLTTGELPTEIRVVDKIKDTLVGYGLSECTTYSFTSPKFVSKLKLEPEDERINAIGLVNPIGEALSVMRTTLTHSMLETLAYNVTHFVNAARLFEVARVYLPKQLPLEDLPVERQKLVIGMYGDGADFFEAKGAVETVLDALGCDCDVRYVRSAEPFLHPGRGADVLVNGKKAGYVGEVHPDVAEGYGVDNVRLYVAELYIDMISGPQSLEKHKFSPFTRFPLVERDLAVVVDESVFADELIDAVTSAKIAHLVGVNIFDFYKGDQIGIGKKSIALRFVFADLERTLKDEEVNESMEKALRALRRKTGAKIR